MKLKKWVEFVNESKEVDVLTDEILDKISKSGIKSLSPKELDFLNSVSTGNEDDINDKKRYLNSKTWVDNQFEFTMFESKDNGDTIELMGELNLPDIKYDDTFISGKNIKGKFIINKDQHMIIPNFEKEEYEHWDFVEGLEYEFDNFIQDILDDIIDFY
jgi:glutaredoxin-related protein